MPAVVVTVELKNTFLSFSDSPRPNFRRAHTSHISFESSETASCCSPLPSPYPLSPASQESRTKVLDEYVASVAEECLQTTVMIRGIPKSYSQEMLLAEVAAEGLPINFLYLPPGKVKSNRSYGFVNFETEAAAELFLCNFKGHQWLHERSKPATVGFATLQGYEQNVQFYKKQEVAKGIAKRAPWVKAL